MYSTYRSPSAAPSPKQTMQQDVLAWQENRARQENKRSRNFRSARAMVIDFNVTIHPGTINADTIDSAVMHIATLFSIS